jgi:plastin-1
MYSSYSGRCNIMLAAEFLIEAHSLIEGFIRKYPQFPQNEIFSLQDAFRKLDVEDKGYLDEATVIKATQQSERQSYDVVRQALKEVELDSSRRVELEDYVDVSCALLETF